MKFLYNTVSLCNHCYRHVPAIVIEKDEKICLTKQCPTHGEMQEVVEPDAEFYYSVAKAYPGLKINSIVFEATDRCQLACPHCYHVPDNDANDVEFDVIKTQLQLFPQGYDPLIAGAEPLLYKKIFDLVSYIDEHYGYSKFLTNGIRFADEDFTKKIFAAGRISPSIGLNHKSYQGEAVHRKQLAGIANVKQYTKITDFSYTVEDWAHLGEILEEIDNIYDDRTLSVRIRGGADIGRSSGDRNYLSVIVKKLKEQLGNELVSTPDDDNTYYRTFDWKGKKLRIAQWPDVKTFDLEEIQCGPWANFVNGPVTHFLHQIIRRDAFKLQGLPKLDECPPYYHAKTHDQLDITRNWRYNWQGPIGITDLEYKWIDQQRTPLSVFPGIPVNTI